MEAPGFAPPPQPEAPPHDAPVSQGLPIASPAPLQPAAGMCFQHQTVAAVQSCASCGVGVCPTCDFVIPAPNPSNSMLQLGTDRHLCPNCVSPRGAGIANNPSLRAPALPLGAGIMCVRHAEVEAVRHCNICHTPMCQTCDFELPGYFHVCPSCATNPKREMSSGRKRNMILSYVLGAWATLGIAATFAGAFAGMVQTKSGEEAFGMIFGLLVFLPSIAGTALGVSTIDRKLANPPAIWVAVIWNAIILAILIILTIIGNLS